MKKCISVLLAVMLLMTFTSTVFAAETGSITIKETVKGQAYSIYQMATLDAYDTEKGAYLYTPVEAWEDFFKVDNAGYFEFNSEGNIIRKDGVVIDAAAFAKDALAYAEENDIAITGTAKTASADNEEIVFDGLSLGYYLVDSSLGALCGLTTTAPDAEINEKNAAPTIDKFVEEDSLIDDGIDGNEWVKENDVSLFQDYRYKTVITVQKGAVGYVLHDKMDAGITWAGSVQVSVGGTSVAAGEATYTLATGCQDGCTFEITFADSYVAGLAEDTQIVVTYSAKLNKDAKIYTLTNNNETWLKYGDNNNTTHITTMTKTYQFGFVKTDAVGEVLDGAEFRLYDAASGGAELAVVKVGDGVYRLAEGTESGVVIETKNGVATVVGLDGNNTKYYIEETKAPTGYNKLATRQEVTIDNQNLDASSADGAYASGIQIKNFTGLILPETGGFGTVLIIVIGGIMVLGAGVLLFAKKRMSQVAE